MNVRKTLLVAGAGLGGAALLRYLYKNIMLAAQWNYSVDDFKLVQVTPRLKANMYFTIFNKSALSAIVKDIDIRVFSEGKELSKIYQTGPYTVMPDGKTKIFVTIDVKPEAVFNNWRVLLSQIVAKSDISLDFVGNMKLKTPFGWVKIPIKFSNTGKNLYLLYKEYY
jgi:LEA14-like dessication related protein